MPSILPNGGLENSLNEELNAHLFGGPADSTFSSSEGKIWWFVIKLRVFCGQF